MKTPHPLAWTMATVFLFVVFLVLAVGFQSSEYRAWWPFLNLLAFLTAGCGGCTIGAWIVFNAQKHLP